MQRTETSTNQIIEINNTILDEYPGIDEAHPSDKKNQITIGDLHGNALKLIYFLIRQNVLEISPEDYQKLKTIYYKFSDTLKPEDLQEFHTILQAAKVKDVGTVRLIGDEMADRGNNDYFTLKVLEKLVKSKVHTEILLSNHSVEFVHAYEHGTDFTPPMLHYQFTRSMFGLKDLVDKKLVQADEVLQMINNCYKPCMKALSYTVNSNKTKITIFSHAGIGLNCIKGMAAKLNVPYKDDTIDNLMLTINNINSAYEMRVKNNTVHELYDRGVMFAGYQGLVLDPEKNPFEFLMWNRFYGPGLVDRPAQHNGYDLDFGHGHDLSEASRENIYNLDNNFGKTPEGGSYPSTYHILYSTDTPAPRSTLELNSNPETVIAPAASTATCVKQEQTTDKISLDTPEPGSDHESNPETVIITTGSPQERKDEVQLISELEQECQFSPQKKQCTSFLSPGSVTIVGIFAFTPWGDENEDAALKELPFHCSG